ncbi:MAG TPA: NrsF family protein [Vicinamibacterales bacterium]|nr:NrsF family protein [Vicinamibacterales bacterium]
MSAPNELRDRIRRDLRPTKPLRPPYVRALVLIPLAVATVLSVPGLRFFRSDMLVIGFLKAWGFSFGQALAGLVIVGVALRESIPGRGLSRGAIAATIVIGLAIPVVLLAVTASAFNIGPEPGQGFEEGIGCFRVSAISAIPALIAAAFLAARALPTRPALAGALYGLGCGLIADAGLRLFCGYTAPGHVLLGHGGAVVAAMGLGAILARIIPRP